MSADSRPTAGFAQDRIAFLGLLALWRAVRAFRIDRTIRAGADQRAHVVQPCPLPSPNEGALAAMNADDACDQARWLREKMNKYARSSRPANITRAQRFPYGPAMIDFAR